MKKRYDYGVIALQLDGKVEILVGGYASNARTLEGAKMCAKIYHGVDVAVFDRYGKYYPVRIDGVDI